MVQRTENERDLRYGWHTASVRTIPLPAHNADRHTEGGRR